MLRPLRTVLLLLAFTVAAPAALTGCNRWRPAQSYVIEGSTPAKETAETVSQVLAAKKYQVKSREGNDFVVIARNFETSEAQRSYIKIKVSEDGHKVVLTASGYLARADGTIHKKLQRELDDLESTLARRLAAKKGSSPKAPAPEATAAANAGGLPRAWGERAYEPSTWGTDEFTCIPAKIAPEDQPELRLRLSDGSEANVAISIAYAAELCRSPKACSLPGGCPALGLGDEQQVKALAERLSKQEITGEATLVVRGNPVASLDLTQHGSVAKALLLLKK